LGTAHSSIGQADTAVRPFGEICAVGARVALCACENMAVLRLAKAKTTIALPADGGEHN